MEDCYYELSVNDNLRDPLLDYIRSNDRWRFHRDFYTQRIPSSLFQNTSINDLVSEFSGEPTIFKMDPNTWYSWHTDAVRSCAVNMLIDGEDSLSLFGEMKGDHHLWNFIEIPHRNNKCFLVNTLKDHAVLNRSCTRYMLSIGFYLPITFEVVKSKCIEYNL